jgi:hypothetical protein
MCNIKIIINATPNAENLAKLNDVQNELKILREKKVDGIITRAKARWHLEGEKNSKYFCNLENRHYQEKAISQLIDSDRCELNEIKNILKEQKAYYENLYKSKYSNITRENLDLFFAEDVTVQILTNDQTMDLESEISEAECVAAMKKINLKNLQVQTVLPWNFIIFFWNEIKYTMIRSFRRAFLTGELSGNQTLGVITCLPKPGKDKDI